MKKMNYLGAALLVAASLMVANATDAFAQNNRNNRPGQRQAVPSKTEKGDHRAPGGKDVKRADKGPRPAIDPRPARRPAPAPRPVAVRRPAPRPVAAPRPFIAPRPVIAPVPVIYRTIVKVIKDNAYDILPDNVTVGTIISQLPDGYSVTNIDGNEYYLYGNILFKAIALDGQGAFQVVTIFD